jgi:ParB/Sulfiredoxin domain
VTWKNRITGVTMEPPEDLLANPANARRHPGPQREALRDSLHELGWITGVIVNDRTGYVVDGHARVEEAISDAEPAIPVIHVNLTPEEERLALGVLDPISAMATYDADALEALIASIETESMALNDLLASLASEAVDSVPIRPAKMQTLVLHYNVDDYSEITAALSVLHGSSASDKVLRVVRQALE